MFNIRMAYFAGLLFGPFVLYLSGYAQEESSPLLKEREKESGLKKIKACTGIRYAFDADGKLSSRGTKLFNETYNQAGLVVQYFLYSPDGKIEEADKYRYDTAYKLIAEKKQMPGARLQIHTYHYGANGRIESGEVHMDTVLIHRCSYKYDDKNRLSEILTRHFLPAESGSPSLEMIAYQYDDKGEVVKESDSEIQGEGGTQAHKVISDTEYEYGPNAMIAQAVRRTGKTCDDKTEYRYDAEGKISEEIHYPACGSKPDFEIKYEYRYY